jgi:hypothetical protein
MMLGLFGSSSAAAAQVRAAKHMDAIRKSQESLFEESEMTKVQALAYDPEHYPHCIDLPALRR